MAIFAIFSDNLWIDVSSVWQNMKKKKTLGSVLRLNYIMWGIMCWYGFDQWWTNYHEPILSQEKQHLGSVHQVKITIWSEALCHTEWCRWPPDAMYASAPDAEPGFCNGGSQESNGGHFRRASVYVSEGTLVWWGGHGLLGLPLGSAPGCTQRFDPNSDIHMYPSLVWIE